MSEIKPRYKILATPALVTIRFKDGTELKMSPQYAGRLAVQLDQAAASAETKAAKILPRRKQKVEYLDECPPEGTYKFKEVVEDGTKRIQMSLMRRPDIDEANDKLAAARSDEIRKGWDKRMQEAEAIAEERLGSRNALNAAIVAGYDPASGKSETVVGYQRVESMRDVRERIQALSVELDLKKAETDAMEKAVADSCPLTN